MSEDSERRELPTRRSNETFKVRIFGTYGPQSLYLTVGYDANGQVAEFFTVLEKTGSQERGFIDAMARSVSVALQYGAPLSAFVETHIQTQGSPRGLVQGHDAIRSCVGPVDLIFRILGIEYCSMEHLKQK